MNSNSAEVREIKYSLVFQQQDVMCVFLLLLLTVLVAVGVIEWRFLCLISSCYCKICYIHTTQLTTSSPSSEISETWDDAVMTTKLEE